MDRWIVAVALEFEWPWHDARSIGDRWWFLLLQFFVESLSNGLVRLLGIDVVAFLAEAGPRLDGGTPSVGLAGSGRSALDSRASSRLSYDAFGLDSDLLVGRGCPHLANE